MNHLMITFSVILGANLGQAGVTADPLVAAVLTVRVAVAHPAQGDART